jgi:putative spermidine/putrescine transport system ATP-binding protein
MTGGASIALSAVAKTFPGGVTALKPTSLSLARGETVVFLGPSGCGKTTCLRLIAGLDAPDAGGRVLFDGEDVSAVPIERRNVGMVFQSYALFPNMTVAENIGYGLKLRKVAAAEKARRVGEMLALTGIVDLAARRVDQLSGGQRQRVALARAVAIRPRVLLLDEPLTALDAALRERLRGELDALLRGLGITTIYVTHDQAEAMALGDRVVVMRKGEVAQVGTPREIYFDPANRFVAEFVGAANILEGPVEAGHMTLPGGRVTVPPGPKGGAMMIRPEAIRLIAPEAAEWRGAIASTSFLGDRTRLTVTGAAARPLVVDAPYQVAARAGDVVGLAVDAGAARMLPSDTP